MPFTSTRVLRVKKEIDNTKGVKKLGGPYTLPLLGGNVKWYSCFGKKVW
jgi:hypothetical protein